MAEIFFIIPSGHDKGDDKFNDTIVENFLIKKEGNIEYKYADINYFNEFYNYKTYFKKCKYPTSLVLRKAPLSSTGNVDQINIAMVISKKNDKYIITTYSLEDFEINTPEFCKNKFFNDDSSYWNKYTVVKNIVNDLGRDNITYNYISVPNIFKKTLKKLNYNNSIFKPHNMKFLYRSTNNPLDELFFIDISNSKINNKYLEFTPDDFNRFGISADKAYLYTRKAFKLESDNIIKFNNNNIPDFNNYFISIIKNSIKTFIRYTSFYNHNTNFKLDEFIDLYINVIEKSINNSYSYSYSNSNSTRSKIIRFLFEKSYAWFNTLKPLQLSFANMLFQKEEEKRISFENFYSNINYYFNDFITHRDKNNELYINRVEKVFNSLKDIHGRILSKEIKKSISSITLDDNNFFKIKINLPINTFHRKYNRYYNDYTPLSFTVMGINLTRILDYNRLKKFEEQEDIYKFICCLLVYCDVDKNVCDCIEKIRLSNL